MPSLGILPVQNADQMRAVALDHAQKQAARMAIDPMSFAQEQASKDASVYIYNVGPWAHPLNLASLGKKLIWPLAVEKVFSTTEVSEPLVVEGQPHEIYPMEKAVRLFHGRKRPAPQMIDGQLRDMLPSADSEEGKRFRNPGFDLAMEMLGHGIGQHKSNSLDRYGVFISEFEAPKGKPIQPSKPRDQNNIDQLVEYGQAMYKFKEDETRWISWQKMVVKAQSNLRAYCAQLIQLADDLWKQGNFATEFPDANRKRLRDCAELLNINPKEHGWLGDAQQGGVRAKSCLMCGDILLASDALTCKFGHRQLPDAAYEAELKRRMDAATAA